MKMMIMDKLGPAGTLTTERVATAQIQHRNCPDFAFTTNGRDISGQYWVAEYLPTMKQASSTGGRERFK